MSYVIAFLIESTEAQGILYDPDRPHTRQQAEAIARLLQNSRPGWRTRAVPAIDVNVSVKDFNNGNTEVFR